MLSSKSKSSLYVLLFVVLLAVGVYFLNPQSAHNTHTTEPTKTETQRGLNRNPTELVYSKHAQCRMDCRQISTSEVKDILANGRINYSKSEIGQLPECKRKYALEGNTSDGQKVRIIFAPCNNKVTVVTVIDLGKEWPCDCK